MLALFVSISAAPSLFSFKIAEKSSPSESIRPQPTLQSTRIQKLVCNFSFLFLFCFFTFRILILYNYNCYFPYLRRRNMFLNLAEWISPTPVPYRYFILLISIRSYGTEVPVSMFWMFKRNPQIRIFIKRINHFLFVC